MITATTTSGKQKRKMAKRVVHKVGGYCSTPGGYRSCTCRKKRGLPCLRKKITAKKTSGKKAGKKYSLHKMLHLGHHARKKIQAKHGLYVIGKRIKRIYAVFKHLKKAKAMAKTSKSLSKAMVHHAMRAFARAAASIKKALQMAKSKLGSKAKKAKARMYKVVHYFHKCTKGKACHTTKVKAVLKKIMGFHPLIKKKAKNADKKAGKSPSSKKLKKFKRKIMARAPKHIKVGGYCSTPGGYRSCKCRKKRGLPCLKKIKRKVLRPKKLTMAKLQVACPVGRPNCRCGDKKKAYKFHGKTCYSYSCKMCKRKVLKPKKMKMAKRVVHKVGGYCSTPGGYRSCTCRKKRGLPCLKKKMITAKKTSGKEKKRKMILAKEAKAKHARKRHIKMAHEQMAKHKARLHKVKRL